METEFRSPEWSVQVKRALVTLTIEKTITEKFGRPLLETVSKRLFDRYNCYIPDCYECPEYLHRVLEDLFGDSYLTIAKSIWDNVGYYLLILPKFNEEYALQGILDAQKPLFNSKFNHYQMNDADSDDTKRTNETTIMVSETIKRLNLKTFVN